jgi:Serine/Threonine/Tyrosine Kinase found in polyvalent proteins
MLNDDTRNQIQDIISGTPINWQADYCTTTRNYLCTSYSPGTTVKKDFEGQQQIKKEQGVALETYISKNDLWVKKPPQEQHLLTIGGEAEIYIDVEHQQVIKLNDAIYYATWLDYLTSIIIHNLLFPETGYELIGFSKQDNELLAVLIQPYIISDAAVNLQEVNVALEFIG